MFRRISAQGIGFLLLFLLSSLAASAQYAVTDLGTLYPDTAHPGQYLGSSYAYGINNYSRIVGQTDVIPTPPSTTVLHHAFLYTGGVMVDLGTLSPDTAHPGKYLGSSTAYGLNDYGQVVGVSDSSSGYSHAFLWTPTVPGGTTGSMIDLGTFYPDNSTGNAAAYAIDSNGQVTGYAERPVKSKKASIVSNAFLWTPTTNNSASGSKQNITPNTLYGATGRAITPNASGDGTQITGSDINGNINIGLADEDDPFLWTPAGGWGRVDNTIPTDPNGHPDGPTAAYGINDFGIVVGHWDDAGNDQTATIWQNGTHTFLGGLQPFAYSTAYGINNVASYTVIGDSTINSGATHAFIYQSGMVDLNTQIAVNSGWVLNSARGVNNAVQIVGFGTINNNTHAFWLH